MEGNPGRVVAFRFRRSVRLLPGVRLNLSKSGASVSLGGRGFHYTVGPKGTRTTLGIPGTGLSWTEYSPHKSGASSGRPSSLSNPPYPSHLPVPRQPDSAIVSIESKTGTEINAVSTSQLAPILNSAYRRIRFAPAVFFVCCCLFIIALGSNLQETVGLTALYMTIIVPIAIFLDRYRRSVRVSLKLNQAAQTITEILAESFSDLNKCNRIWSINAEAQVSDWKRNAGATKLNKREDIRPRITRPSCLRGRVAFPKVKLGSAEIFFLPDAILIVSKKSVAALHYRDLHFSYNAIRFIEEGRLPSDTMVVDHTWRFVNKSGGPDRRFNSNRQLPICQYGEMNFASSGGLNGRMQFSNFTAGQKFATAIEILIKHAAAGSDLAPIATYSRAKRWPTIVFLSVAFAICAGLGLVGGLTNPTIRAAVSKGAASRQDESSHTSSEKGAYTVQPFVQPRTLETKKRGTRSGTMNPLNISPVLPSASTSASNPDTSVPRP